jgi:hypothetical protein
VGALDTQGQSDAPSNTAAPADDDCAPTAQFLHGWPSR